MTTLEHNGPDLLRIGVLVADDVDSSSYPQQFEEILAPLLLKRAQGLVPEEDAWRQSVRDILRNGRYKPTGRGKPASEYLLRAAKENAFPRINALVDICNYISLLSLFPVSIWDLDRVGTDRYKLRLGFEEESYVFNDAGQSIDLRDLVVGCAVDDPTPEGRAIVNPVKDSMSTKTTPETTRVGAIVYGRSDDGPMGTFDFICSQFAGLLSGCGRSASATYGIIDTGKTTRL